MRPAPSVGVKLTEAGQSRASRRMQSKGNANNAKAECCVDATASRRVPPDARPGFFMRVLDSARSERCECRTRRMSVACGLRDEEDASRDLAAVVLIVLAEELDEVGFLDCERGVSLGE